MDLPERRGLLAPAVRVQVQGLGMGVEAALRRGLGGSLGHQLLEPLQLLLHPGRLIPPDDAAPRQMGEDRRQRAVVEVGRQELHPGKPHALAHRLQQRPLVLAGEAQVVRPLLDPRQGLAAGLRPGGELLHGQEQQLFVVGPGALGPGVELADGIDAVVGELHPHGPVIGRGEDVHDAAAHAEVAAFLHQRGAGEAQAGELPQEFFPVDFLTLDEVGAPEALPGHHALHYGGRGRHQ